MSFKEYENQTQKQWLGSQTNFENSQISVAGETYKFCEEIGAGAQGKVLLYESTSKSLERPRKGVLKVYTPGNDSTQASKEDPYWSFLNENDMLTFLTTYSKTDALIEVLKRQNRLEVDDDKNIIIDGTKVPGGYIIRAGVNTNHQATPYRHPAPIVLGRVDKIECEGQTIIPMLKPPSQQQIIFGFSEESPVTLSEYCNGETLADTLKKEYDPQKLFDILVKSTATLHHYGICHRDIKPENIIIDEEAKLVDFGIAQFFSLSDRAARIANLTHSSSLHEPARANSTISKGAFGSRIYSSPSALEGFVSNQDDIFSLGIIGCILYTRKHPLTSLTFDEYLKLSHREKKNLHREVSSFLTTCSENSSAMESLEKKIESLQVPEVIKSMCQPNPRKRPSRMCHVAAERKVNLPPLTNIVDVKEIPRTSWSQEITAEEQALRTGGARVFSALDYEIDIFTPQTGTREEMIDSAIAQINQDMS